MKNVKLTRLAPFNFGVVLYSIASPLSVYNNGCQILGLPYAQYADVSRYWSILLHQRTGGVSQTSKVCESGGPLLFTERGWDWDKPWQQG